MSLQVQGVAYVHPDKEPLFQNISFTVQQGEKCAIIGNNGIGKSTLLSIMAGKTACAAGMVACDSTPYLIPQHFGQYDSMTVAEALGVAEKLAAMEAILGGQGTEHDFTLLNDEWDIEDRLAEAFARWHLNGMSPCTPMGKLCGGEKTKAFLAGLNVFQPSVALMDEPTNHLDLLSLLWLQRYLKNYPGAILMISHDRDFMDELVESVYDIDNEELVEYRGNYTDFLKQRDVRFEQLQAAYRNQQKEIAHIQEFIDRFRSINSKAGQVQSRIKQLEKMKVIQKPVARRKVFKFNFPQPPRSTQKVIELEKVCQSYGDHKVYENLDLLVERGERTVLVGPNGAGKSTLLKILAGIIPIDSGKRIPGTTTRIGYFSQARTENLNPENTVLEEIMKCNAEIREEEARSILGSFLFRRLDVEKRVSVLSGGEKSRLSLVKFLVDPPNLLLMDEPTTHLDLLSVEALVQALKHYEGTLVFISHDVHFIRSLAEKTLHVNRGTITTYAGGYDYYLEKSGILDDEKGGITAE